MKTQAFDIGKTYGYDNTALDEQWNKVSARKWHRTSPISHRLSGLARESHGTGEIRGSANGLRSRVWRAKGRHRIALLGKRTGVDVQSRREPVRRLLQAR